MARVLVLGEPVMPMTPGVPPIASGAVAVENGRIVAVGCREDMQRLGPFAATLGSENHVVLPGLVNGHHHAGRTLRAGLADLPFERRNLVLHRLVTAGTEESLYRSTLHSCVELLRAGVTSAAVIFYPNTALPHLGAEAALQAYFDSGMRVAFAVAQRDRALYVHEDDDAFLRTVPPALAAQVRGSAIGRYSRRSLSNDEYFEQVRGLFRRWHGREGRVRIDVGPDWFPSATDALLLESRRVARELGTQIQMHLLETRYEMLMARRWLGQSAVEHLAAIDFLGPELVCAHSVWLTERDMDLYAAAGVVAVHNPASNLRLFSGIAPVREMLARQVAVAIGCDGLAFADDNDLLSDLRLAGHLQRTPGIMAEGLSARTLLEMATITGARAVGMGAEVGELAPGRWADLILMRKPRMLSPYFHPGIAIEEALLARGRKEDVDVVMVGGQVLVDGGHTIRVDEEALAQALRADVAQASADSPLPTDDALARALEPYAVRLLAGWDWPAPEAGYRYNTR